MAELLKLALKDFRGPIINAFNKLKEKNGHQE